MGKVYEGLSLEEKIFYRSDYLSQYHDNVDSNFIDWLEENRIELNTILAAAKPEAFWNWLKAKILHLWPDRDFRRAIQIEESPLTPTMNKFFEYCENKSKPVVASSVKSAEDELSNVHGFYEEGVQAKKEEIETDIMKNVLLQDEQIKKLDLALEEIMKKYS